MLLTIALVPVLALGLAACGEDDEPAGASAATTETAQTLMLTGEDTTLALDPSTATVLEENQVKVAPVDPAAASDEGIAFPITGGEVDGESLAGTIEHSGGLRFSAGGERLEVTDFRVDTEQGVLFAQAGGSEVPLLDLDLSALERSMEGETIVASGISAALTAEAAEALNTTFGVDLFEEGLAIGDVTVRATA
jgi:hypothetical protein